MSNRTVYCLLFVMILHTVSWSDEELRIATLNELNEFSAASVPLSWNVPASVNDATYSVFIRDADDASMQWNEVTFPEAVSATSIVVPATHGHTYQFRVSANIPVSPQRLVLSRFEPGSSARMVLPVWHQGAMKIEVEYMTKEVPQGALHGEWRYTLAFPDQIDPATPGYSGLYFSTELPETDWSDWRYLEMMVRVTHRDVPLALSLKSGNTEFRKPVLDYSVGESATGWHFIQVDLDEALPERSSITRFALMAPSLEFPHQEEFRIGLDDVSLWKDAEWVETKIDATPPSTPTDMTHAMNGLFIEWRWNPSVDEESDIVGYSTTWGSDIRVMPDTSIDTEFAFLRQPFLVPQRYREFYFRVRAKNKAGLWSPVATVPVTYNPSAPNQ